MAAIPEMNKRHAGNTSPVMLLTRNTICTNYLSTLGIKPNKEGVQNCLDCQKHLA